MGISVGADIESLCGKCGDVWHVVVAMVADRVAKVECKQCGRQHRHRPPNGSATAASAPRASKASAKRATTANRSSKGAQSASALPLIQVDPNKPLRSYTINEEFGVGDRIAHKRFGEGVVEMVLGPDKIQVFFHEGGRRVMAHGR